MRARTHTHIRTASSICLGDTTSISNLIDIFITLSQILYPQLESQSRPSAKNNVSKHVNGEHGQTHQQSRHGEKQGVAEQVNSIHGQINQHARLSEQRDTSETNITSTSGQINDRNQTGHVDNHNQTGHVNIHNQTGQNNDPIQTSEVGVTCKDWSSARADHLGESISPRNSDSERDHDEKISAFGDQEETQTQHATDRKPNFVSAPVNQNTLKKERKRVFTHVNSVPRDDLSSGVVKKQFDDGCHEKNSESEPGIKKPGKKLTLNVARSYKLTGKEAQGKHSLSGQHTPGQAFLKDKLTRQAFLKDTWTRQAFLEHKLPGDEFSVGRLTGDGYPKEALQDFTSHENDAFADSEDPRMEYKCNEKADYENLDTVYERGENGVLAKSEDHRMEYKCHEKTDYEHLETVYERRENDYFDQKDQRCDGNGANFERGDGYGFERRDGYDYVRIENDVCDGRDGGRTLRREPSPARRARSDSPRRLPDYMRFAYVRGCM
jgi:hypothetical protein